MWSKPSARRRAGFREGDRVVLSWAPACGECGACGRGRPAACGPLRAAIGKGTLLGGRTGLSLGGEMVYRGTATGALAEHVVVAAGAAMPLADDVPLEHAALLGCAALTGVGAVLNAARPEPGFSALVIGAGGVGQFVVQGLGSPARPRSSSSTRVEARRAQALAARGDAGVRARRSTRGDEGGSMPRASTTRSTPSARPRRRRSRFAGPVAAGTAVVVGLPAAGATARARPVRVLEPREDADRHDLRLRGSGRCAAAAVSTSSARASSSSAASSAPRSRSTAPTRRSRRASRASRAACS